MNISPKRVDNINTLYVDAQTNKYINPILGELNFRQLCKPDIAWVYDKCLMKSHKYRELLEENYKMKYILEVNTKANEEEAEKVKKTIFNSYDNMNHYDDKTKNNLFLTCSELYYRQCRDFYEKRHK